MTSPEEILDHSNCFKLLAACFYEPDRTMFLEERVIDNLTELLHRLEPAAVEPANIMKESLENSTQEQLSVDHAALFVGPFELIAAPYGSVYLERGRKVLGESTVVVQKLYAEAGLTVDIQEPADHIAIELEFMQYLAFQEADALARGEKEKALQRRALQADFFRRFMGWLPELCACMESGAVTVYYQALGKCMRLFHQQCDKVYRQDLPVYGKAC